MTTAATLIKRFEVSEVVENRLWMHGMDIVIAQTTFYHGLLYIKAVGVMRDKPKAIEVWYNTGVIETKANEMGIKAGLGCRMSGMGAEMGVYVQLANGRQLHLALGSKVDTAKVMKEINMPKAAKDTDKAKWIDGAWRIATAAGSVILPFVVSTGFSWLQSYIHKKMNEPKPKTAPHTTTPAI